MCYRCGCNRCYSRCCCNDYNDNCFEARFRGLCDIDDNWEPEMNRFCVDQESWRRCCPCHCCPCARCCRCCHAGCYQPYDEDCYC